MNNQFPSYLAKQFIDKYFYNPHDIPDLLLVTGLQGTGKTTWCLELAEYARASGFTVKGLISPAVFMDGRKVGIDLLDLTSTERRKLAVLWPPNSKDTNNFGLCWQFDDETVTWGDGILAGLGSCDLLIIDELGPLEFTHGLGWQAALPLISSREYRLTCVVIRPSLVDKAIVRWPWGQVMPVTPTLRQSK